MTMWQWRKKVCKNCFNFYMINIIQIVFDNGVWCNYFTTKFNDPNLARIDRDGLSLNKIIVLYMVFYWLHLARKIHLNHVLDLPWVSWNKEKTHSVTGFVNLCVKY